MTEKKLYHTIGQVSEFTDLPQSVLRYWETVFPRFNPNKSPGGNRLYTDEDVKLIEKIKELLYVQKFTIRGANSQLEQEFVDNGNPFSEKESKLNAESSMVEEVNHNSSLSKKEIQNIIVRLKQIIQSLSD